ncbi:hypothetical protein [Arcobacter cloacae]|uniref:Uncharacterized protein n=1 Tax=Arcobacter cloacae TaxID=1054034 RepID=A0A6M8NFR2_9BACT|nr:hypothetical protein [Arcobacter cloacae]QKF89129.1 hypothetical protein ACLO_0604 [Arcobacter cloacae]RXI42490.1 hypothetical protein CP963_03025 [Arcobacter cloacae]
MSQIIYDFLKDSFLYDDRYIENYYSIASELELKNEFTKYRNYILRNMSKLHEEITLYANQIKIFSIDKFIDFSKIRQMSFYLDQVIISDPLFKIATPNNLSQDVFSEYLGIKKENNIDRQELTNIMQNFKKAEVLVEATYLKFFPTSYFFELKSEIPLLYSETQFYDALPKNIMDLYHKNTELRTFKKNGPYLTINKNFERDRTLEVLFKNDDTIFTNMYNLFEQKIISYDEKTNVAEFIMTLPNTVPSKESFDNWVFQSINQSAISHFKKISLDINLSMNLKAQYSTTSIFVDMILKSQFNIQSDIKSHVSNLMLNFDLNFFENINIKELMAIRKNDGEEFEVFRRELEKQLRDIKNEKDISIIQSKIQDVKHELDEVQITSINSKIKKIRKKSSIDFIIGTAGLGASFVTGGLSTFATLIALFNGYKTYNDYQDEVKENPSYFLWKVKNNK